MTWFSLVNQGFVFAKGQGRGQSSRDTGSFVISQKSLLLPGKWLDREQTHSANLAFPFSIPFSSTPQPPNGCEFAL